MHIFPAIDIKNGRCVRLTQGRADAETVYFENPVDVARIFKTAGAEWIHVVDLDGAFTGEPQNLGIVRQIAALGMKVQLGGGMRNQTVIDNALAAGVSRVVIGTRAAESETFVAEIAKTHGEKIAVGIDAKDGQVAVKGWVSTVALTALDLAKRVTGLGIRTLIYTDIGTDGMLTGPNLAAQETMCRAVPAANIIASGGVSKIEDVTALKKLSDKLPNLHGVIIGKAIYENRITPAAALAAAKS